MADELSGKIKHAGGKIQEEVGEFLGDKKMRREGKLSQVEGEAEQVDTDTMVNELLAGTPVDA